MKLPRLFASLFSFVVLFASASNASAAFLYFEELANEGGIVIHAENQDGVLSTSGVIAGEVARAGNRDGCLAFGCDLSIDRAGLGNQPQNTAFVMFDADGVTVSDMLIQVGVPGFIVWEFISDPALFPLLSSVNVLNSVVEDGTQQLLGTYSNDQGRLVSLFASSDVDVPEPSTIALLILGLVGIGARRRRIQ